MANKKMKTLKFLFIALALVFLGRLGVANSFLEKIYSGVVPVAKTFSNQGKRLKEQIDLLSSLSSVLAEKKDLEKKIEELNYCRSQLIELEVENKKLRNQLGLRIKGYNNLLSTDIVSWETGISHNLFLIDKGGNTGLENGLPVIYGDYLVGTVIEVFPNQSKVRAVTDRESKVYALADRDAGAHGVVSGYMPGKLIMRKILREEPIETGDLIFTSGENTLPRGLKLGDVSRVYDKELLKEAVLNFPIDLSSLQTVFVLKK